MKTKIGIFNSHYNRLMEIQDVAVLQQEIETIVTQSKINAVDRAKITRDIAPLNNNLPKLQYYLTNSMLKYQGLGTIKTK